MQEINYVNILKLFHKFGDMNHKGTFSEFTFNIIDLWKILRLAGIVDLLIFSK